MSHGETDLSTLLRTLTPALDDVVHVFAVVDEDTLRALRRPPLGLFREAEGVTLLCTPEEAKALDAAHSGPFRRITLTVNSSLEAVGLTAAVSSALAAEGIACNVVAAYHHDHLFVPAPDADRALAILRRLSGRDA